jgi:Asp-tRNA(Asn)/Glu-tRNA(Gln) amidotransferase A subunit family amidase
MSDFPEYENYDAVGLAQLIASKELKATEVIEAAIHRAEKVNPRLNCIVHPMYEEARRKVGNTTSSPLGGVPLLFKDLGVLCHTSITSFGSSLFKDFVPSIDSEIVVRAQNAGMIVLGKTNTSELGLSITTEPKLYGATHNPWLTGVTAGGSSGGSGAAVAARIVPVAHGTDGAGSIRIPASCCGVFGLKPTRGRVPVGPEVGERNGGFFTQHALTRSVRDSAAMLDVWSGPELGDPYAAPHQATAFEAAMNRSMAGLRIAVQTYNPSGAGTDDVWLSVVEDAAKLCADLGHVVEYENLSYDFEALTTAAKIIWSANISMAMDGRWQQLAKPPTPKDCEKFAWYFYNFGREQSAVQYVSALNQIHRLSRDVAAFFGKYDILLTPGLSVAPFELGIFNADTLGEAELWDQQWKFAPFTMLANATGQPAMSVPTYWDARGLPFGSHFMARAGEEETLLCLARQLEEARPWMHRKPALD